MSFTKILGYAFLIILTAVYLATSWNTEDDSILVKTSKGLVKGFTDQTYDGRHIYAFKGIPFAKPPLGDLRFEEPVEPDTWEGVLDASKTPNWCLQHSFPGHVVPRPASGDEDCLYLNVFSPNTKAAKKLPVMVYIHGGGFFSGRAEDFSHLMLLDKDVVLVVIQYRLNVFGFLSTEDKSQPGNIGLKDQVFALKWVQENIGQFGGDPNMVTLFGESAGGVSVHYHMLSPMSQGLFKRVIAQSGSASALWGLNTTPRKTACDFGPLVGCPLHDDSDEFIKCLKNVDAKTLVDSTLKLLGWSFLPLSFAPSVDGSFLPENPALLMTEGKTNNAELMHGITRDDGSFLVYLISLDSRLYDTLRSSFETLGPTAITVEQEPESATITKAVFEHYLNGEMFGNDKLEEMVKLCTGIGYEYPSRMSSFLHSRDLDVYTYELHHRGQYSFGDYFKLEEWKTWVCHTDDLIYLFLWGGGAKERLEDPEDIQVKDIMVTMWTNFAATGNPTPDDSLGFKWNKATPTRTSNYLKITPNPTNEEYSKERIENLDFWLSLPFSYNKEFRKYA